MLLYRDIIINDVFMERLSLFVERRAFNHTEVPVQSSPLSICCVLDQDTISALLLSTQLTNECSAGATS